MKDREDVILILNEMRNTTSRGRLMRPRITWGSPGHEWEWVLLVPGFDTQNQLPPILAEYLKERCPGVWIEDRGSRIEIYDREGNREDFVRIFQVLFDGDVDVIRRR